MTLMRRFRRMHPSMGLFLAFILVFSGFANLGSPNTALAEESSMNESDRITRVISPAYRSDIHDDTITIEFYNKLGTSAVVYSQKQPDDLSIDSNGLRDVVGEADLADGYGTVEFRASEYPYGPISLRIQVFRDGTEIDNCYLQLYNHVGVKWKTGLDHAPVNPVTAGMDVVYADDFKSMPSISRSGIGAQYASAKIDEERGGMFGWAAFEDYDGPYNPFAVVGDEYMRLATTYHPTGYVRNDYWKQRASTGYLSSENQAGTGFHTEGGRNQYFEARMFFGPNPGLWPAFWLLTANGYVQNPNLANEPSDELDIIEGYMGSPSGYQIAWHPWGYDKDPDSGYDPSKLGGGMKVNLDTPVFNHINLAMGFHTFGVYITKEWTYYYCDNIEVAKHKTLPYSWEYGNYFIINAALSDHYGISPNSDDPFENFEIPDGFTRYGNESYTYVDWVRVYQDPPGKVRFESEHSVKAPAGDVLHVNIHRNAPAAALSGHYRIELPGGWKILEGEHFVEVNGVYEAEFSAGVSSDTLTLLVADDYTETENIKITPVSDDGVEYDPMVIRAEARSSEGELVRVDSNTYPYRSKSGETAGSWLNYDPDTNLKNYFNFISGNWWRDSWSWMYVAANPDSVMQFQFDGVSVALEMIQCDICGTVDIYLDGEFQKRFDSYGVDAKPVRAFEKSGLEDGSHTLEIRGVEGPPGRYIRISGFEYRYFEDPTIPKFWSDDTYFVAGPGDELTVTIQRNGAAGTKFGEYDIRFPSEGWLVFVGGEWRSVTRLPFSTNYFSDTIVLKVPEGYSNKNGKVVITPTTGDGSYDPIRITVQAPDAPEAEPIAGNGEIIMVDSNSYPYVRRPDAGYDSWTNFDKSTQPIDYFTFNGGWWSDSWSWMYTAASPGQTLTFTFEGDAVALYARYHSGGSSFDIYLDGVKQASVDTLGNSGKRRVFSKSGLPADSHVLEIKVTGTGGTVAIEGFEYSYIPSPPAPKVRVDATSAPYGGGSWSQTSQYPFFQFNGGGWWSDSWAWMYDNADNVNESVDFTFTGTSIALYMNKMDIGGMVNIYLDGNLEDTLDTYSSEWVQSAKVFERKNLPAGEHTLRVEVAGKSIDGGAVVSITAFEYSPSETNETVSVTLGEHYAENGMSAWGGDGPGTTTVTYDGKSGWQTNPASGARYLYFNVFESFINGGTNSVNITIEYFDAPGNGNQGFVFSYDSAETAWDYQVPKTILQGSNRWKTVTYTLNDAQFSSRENGADFRIEADIPVAIASVVVAKNALPSTAAAIQAVPEEVTLPQGSAFTVAAAILDQNGYIMNKLPISWSSDNAAVAAVNSNGTITAVKAGTTAIRATYGSISAAVLVTVQPLNSDPGPVSVILGESYAENGISAWGGDSAGTTTVHFDGKSGWQTNPASGAHYIYFNVNDAYIFDGKNTVRITVEYYDAQVSGNQGFLIAYHSTAAPFAYTEKTLLEGSNTWKTVTYTIEDARFANQANGADFRLETGIPIAFASVSVEKIPAVSMRGAQVKTGNIFLENEQPAIQLVFDNQFDTDKELSVVYKVTDYANHLVESGQFDVRMGPHELGSVHPLSFNALPKGTYTLSVDAASPDGTIRLHETIYFGVIADLTGKDVHDFFGVNTHFNKGYGGWEHRIPLAKQAGATSIRDGYSGNDGYIDTALANGVNVLVVTSTDVNEIRQTAERLKGKAEALEIGNELSAHYTPEQYFEIVQDAYAVIKEADPNIKVVVGVTLQYDAPWLKRLVDLGICDYADAISFHVYTGKNPEGGGILDAFRDLQNYIESKGIAGEIELWLTETGWPTQDPNWGGFPEMIQAAYGAQLYVENLANDKLIDEIHWYDFINDCTDPTYFECRQGLLHIDNAPKPSFLAFNAVSDLLAGTEFVRSYNTLDSDVRIYKFHRPADAQDILVVWSNQDKPIGLNLGASRISAADLFGNLRQYDTVNGVFTFTAAAQPVYIVGSFTQDPVLAAPVFLPEPSLVTAAPGDETTIRITRSGGAETLSGTYEVELPSGWQLVSGGEFSAGQQTDALIVKAPAEPATGEIRIYPKSDAGDLYGSLRLQTSMVEGSVIQVAPQVNEAGNGWDLAVKIMNQNSQQFISGGTVTVLEPSDMAGSLTFDPIAPGSSAILTFPAPSIRTDAPMRVKLQIEREDGFTKVIERNISALTAVKTDQPIQIDGIIDAEEWNHAMSFKLDQASQVRLIPDWGGPDDLSAAAYAKWDEDYLYLAVRVTDNEHFNPYLPGDLWKGDSVQFTIDPGRAAEPGSLGWSENNIALHSETNAVMKTGGYGGNDLSGSLIRIQRDGTNTVYEMAIKWTDILPAGMEPVSGTDLGFSFLVNDNDGSLRRGWMEYMSGIGLSKDPTLYGDLILTDRTSLSIPGTEPPVTEISVFPADPDGQNGWYVQPVTVALTAGSSTVTEIVYSLDDGSTWHAYTAPVTFDQDGIYSFSCRSLDREGNMESVRTIRFQVDRSAPVITVDGLNEGRYPSSGSLTPQFTVTDLWSGVDESKTVVLLDGQPVRQGETIHLYTLPLGTHTFTVQAADLAGNAAAAQITFVTYADPESLKSLVQQFRDNGRIDNAGIANSLLKKLEHGQLQAFIQQVRAQSGKHISAEAADYLLRDAQAVLNDMP